MNKILIYRKHSKANIELYRIFDFIKRHSNTVLIYSLFWSGFILGIAFLISEKSIISQDAEYILSKYIFSENNFFVPMSTIISLIFVIILFSIIFSFNIIGSFLIYLLPFICGFLTSGIPAYIITSDQIESIIILLVIFSATFSIVLYIMNNFFIESQRLSFIIKSSYKNNNKNETLRTSLKKYFLYAFISLVLISLLIAIFYSCIAIF